MPTQRSHVQHVSHLNKHNLHLYIFIETTGFEPGLTVARRVSGGVGSRCYEATPICSNRRYGGVHRPICSVSFYDIGSVASIAHLYRLLDPYHSILCIRDALNSRIGRLLRRVRDP